MQTFRSKIDLWLIAVLIGSSILPILITWWKLANLMTGTLIGFSMFLFIGWLFWATRYVVHNKALIVHTGFGKIVIPIDGIKSVTPSRNLLASPALSLDRLEIEYGENEMVLISPKDKVGFLKAIGLR